MKSFKLEKSQGNNNQLVQGGVFLAIIGLPVMVLFSLPAGFIMILAGIALALAGKFAS